MGEGLLKLKEHGVILAQCANTLRQAQGWAYIHPTPPSLME